MSARDELRPLEASEVAGEHRSADEQERHAERAYRYCLRRLTGAPCTEQQLREGLVKRGYDEAVVDDVLHRLRTAGLVNDRLFAQLWVESRARSKGLTAPVLRAELRRKGIADELSDEAIEQLDPGDERERAVELVRRKLRGPVPPHGPERDRLIRRLGGMLARKGHPTGRAFAIVSEVLNDHPSGDVGAERYATGSWD